MNRTLPLVVLIAVQSALVFTACGGKVEANLESEEPPPAVSGARAGCKRHLKVDHPEQFPLVTAAKYDAAPELNVTGTVSPGRLAERAGDFAGLRPRGRDSRAPGRHGDQGPAADARAERRHLAGLFRLPQAVADETLAHAQLDRAKILYDKGAIAQKDLEVAAGRRRPRRKSRRERRRSACACWAPT